MTEDWQPAVLIEGIQADYDPDGSLHQENAVEVKVNYVEEAPIRFEPDEIENPDEIDELQEKYEPGELIEMDYRNGAYARLRYDVEDGVAVLSEFKDPSPKDANWVGFEFLRTVKAAEQTVKAVPGVESVERAEETLGRFIEASADATIDRA